MSITIMAQVYATKLGSATLKAVALKLADYANDAGGNVWPALDTVAEHTEVSKSTVQRSIKEMLASGLLELEREGGKGPGSTTRYRFNLRCLAAAPKIEKGGQGDHDGQGDHLYDGQGDHPKIEKGGQGDHRTIKKDKEKGEERVSFDGTAIQLHNGLRSFWLDKYGGDAERLELALIAAVPYVQPNSNRPLEAQVSAQLARSASDKRDRDQRAEASRRAPARGPSNIFDRKIEGARRCRQLLQDMENRKAGDELPKIDG